MKSLPQESARIAPDQNARFAQLRGQLSIWGRKAAGLSAFLARRQFPIVFLGFLVLAMMTTAGCEWGAIGYNKGYAPEQPIPFSHELHAGQYKIQCLYCHSGVERSMHSPVPSLNICMNCHLVVATDRPAIQKLTEAYNKKQPIPWVKVHMLPDHVKFNHKAHVQKFGAPQACHKCHGPVESMETMYQNASLSMGWCIQCHRQPENQAPTNCSTCHY